MIQARCAPILLASIVLAAPLVVHGRADVAPGMVYARPGDRHGGDEVVLLQPE